MHPNEGGATGHEVTRLALPGKPVCLITDLADAMVGGVIRHDRIWEPVETVLMHRVVHAGEQVADIGAHIGYFTVLLSRLVGPTGRVVAFEPEPGNLELLKANCVLNGCSNVDLHDCALAAERGSRELFLSPSNRGDHRLTPTANRTSLPVEAARFDDLWAGRGPLDFAKIDAQGFELPILWGMVRTIAASTGRLICMIELSPGLSRAAGADLDGYLKFLNDTHGIFGRIRAGHCFPSVDRMDEAGFRALWLSLLAAEQEDRGINIILAFGSTAWSRLRARCSSLPWRFLRHELAKITNRFAGKPEAVSN